MKKGMFVVNLWIMAGLFIFCFALGGRDVSGATFCVTNSTELQDALTAAQNNGQDDTIQVVQGTYTGNFTYTAAITENYRLTLQGGFTAGCASRVVDPSNTILDGQNAGRVLTFTADIGNLGARVAIDGFTIKNGQDNNGGGVSVNLPSPITGTTITITNNTISGNSSNNSGGGVYANTIAAAITITNNTISGNSNFGGSGGGVYANTIAAAITITNNTISGNSSNNNGGGVYATATSSNGTITINNNTISGNSSNRWGGGVYAEGNGTTTITDNTIIGNGAGGIGGGVFSRGTATFYNNIIAGNTAVYGGGVYAQGVSQSSVITFTNNTDAMNVAVSSVPAGGLFIDLSHDNASARVYNNIIYGNYAGGQWGYDIYNQSDADGNGTEAAVDICYNDFTTLSGALPLDTGSGCSDVPNSGNISADPLFVDPAGLNFHLQCSISPCVDAGYNSAPGIPSEDIDGEPRIKNGKVDMGADECGATTPPPPSPKICRTCPREFSVRQGRTLCYSFRVWSCVRGVRLNWTVSEGCDWLTLRPTSGTSTGERDSVRACVNTAGLAKGNYQCTVTITGGDASNSPQTCVIKLKVK